MMLSVPAPRSAPRALPRGSPAVVDRHCSEAAFLYTLRRHYLLRGDVDLADLVAFDERCEAHLDGLRTAQQRGWQAAQRALGEAGVGEVFVCALLAIEGGEWGRIVPVLSIVEAQESLWPGLLGAFGWASPTDLRGTVKSLLASESPFYRRVGLAACAIQRVDPAQPLVDACSDSDDAVRARGLRAAGELGKLELLRLCLPALEDSNAECRFWAAWSAVLLGDRADALAALVGVALLAPGAPATHRRMALRLSLETCKVDRGQELLRALREDASARRLVIEGVGWAGNPRYVPWLIEQMADPDLARAAAEAFGTLTGAVLSSGPAVRTDPEPDAGDAAEQEAVFSDADEGLAWPSLARVESWWAAHGSRLKEGQRHFLGAPPTEGRCAQILSAGLQRHRLAAAEHLCLQRPGAMLFDVKAPAWRQRRALAAMGVAGA